MEMTLYYVYRILKDLFNDTVLGRVRFIYLEEGASIFFIQTLYIVDCDKQMEGLKEIIRVPSNFGTIKIT